MNAFTRIAGEEREEMRETELFALMREKLYTPVVGDILDAKGYMHQFLPQKIRPIRDDMKLAGRAMTVLMIDVFGVQEKPFGRLCECLDQIQPGEIYIAAGGTGRCAYWGELLTATARARGAVGAVLDGWHRDTPQVLEQNWPVFSWGCYAQDSSVRTQVVDFRCTIEVGQVTVHDGDYIFGDVDGVLVIPGEIAGEVVEEALDKASKEKGLRKAVEGGMSVTEAFAKFGVL
jgi:regulator of RNase E activity RraA